MKRAPFEEEHNWFRESVAAFVDRELMPQRERFREQRLIDRDTWLKTGAAGLLGLGVPASTAPSSTPASPIWAGTNEIMKEVIGCSLGLEEPRWLTRSAFPILCVGNAVFVGYAAGRRRISAARSQRATSSSRWL
jgi:alkylation response protein AidB-like acyl-CoA dehydrogenase